MRHTSASFRYQAALANNPLRFLSTHEEDVSRDRFLEVYRPNFVGLRRPLPRDVHLLSLRSRNPSSGDVVIRVLNEDDRHLSTGIY